MSAHVREGLSAYLDGEVPAAERAAMDAHLRECAECAARLAELAAVDERARALPSESPEGYFDTFPSRVRSRLTSVARPGRWRLPAWTLAAAAALVLAVITPLTLRPRVAVPPAAAPREEPPPAIRAETAPAVTDAPDLKLAEARKNDKREQASAEVKGKVAFATPPTEPPASVPPAAVELLQESPREADALEKKRSDAEEERAELAAEPQPARSAAAGVARQKDQGRSGALAAKQATPPSETESATSTPRTTDDARRLRDTWRTFARDHASDPRADEARVRAIEAAAEAYRLGGDPRDLALVREDAAAYLRRKDARQAERVRLLLRALPPE